MQSIYKRAYLPADRDLIEATNAAAARLHEKLTSAGVHGPRMDEHFREQYWEKILGVRALDSKLKSCAYHIIWGVSMSQRPLNQISLIDHGGGLGLISLMAKELGVGRVIYNDINPKFFEAAQGIARAMGVEVDDYILGDVDRLAEKLGGDVIDVLISYDVLEHIYNLDQFFAALCSSPCCPRVLFMSSSANMFNPNYLRYVIPIHRQKEREYCSKRIAIIRDCSPGLKRRHLALLSRKTRMLVRSEIEYVAGQYIKSSRVELPQKTGANAYDPFRTNTVDPETSMWAEHLLNPFYLANQLEKYRFTAKVKPGFYGKRGEFLNGIIRIAGAALSLPIAPFYTVSAVRNGS